MGTEDGVIGASAGQAHSPPGLQKQNAKLQADWATRMALGCLLRLAMAARFVRMAFG